MRRADSAIATLGLALVASGCAVGGDFSASDRAYVPDRRDYQAFRGSHPELLEPNYLPFMLHRYRTGDGGGDVLAFCRWPLDDMPIAVYVSRSVIPDSLQDEFRERDPDAYVRAVDSALDVWEEGLGGLVGFRRVTEPDDAKLEVSLVAEVGPVARGDRQGLGRIDLRGACRVRGWEVAGERLAVSFAVPRIRIYLADQHGLLDPEQVEYVALHEIGHVLGMSQHSPIPADLMYEIVRDRIQVDRISRQDANSFVSLYSLPNGTVFGRIPPGEEVERPDPDPPSGPPRLSAAVYRDPGRGFSVHPAAGWIRIETARGMVAIDGVSWDYTASFQVIVQRYPTIEEYLDRYREFYRRHGRVLRDAPVVVNGYRARQMDIENASADVAEAITFLESGDGRVLVVIADCPLDAVEAYRPWFEAMLASLEIWNAPAR